MKRILVLLALALALSFAGTSCASRAAIGTERHHVSVGGSAG